jgi:hypothetical protein
MHDAKPMKLQVAATLKPLLNLGRNFVSSVQILVIGKIRVYVSVVVR